MLILRYKAIKKSTKRMNKRLSVCSTAALGFYFQCDNWALEQDFDQDLTTEH